MRKNLIFAILNVFLLANTQAGVDVCMLESDGELYECLPVTNESASSNCQAKYGEEYNAFYKDNRCSEELAYSLMGLEFQEGEEKFTEAACFKFETGAEKNCTYWDYNAAKNFCSTEYGDRFLPHIISNQCSIDAADKEYGYVSPDRLVDGLEEKVNEANAILTMIDREGFQKSFLGLVSFRPVISNEFYTPVMKGLLAKLAKINVILERRSYYKVKFVLNDPSLLKFQRILHFYQSMVSRLFKVYAYVAHRNHHKIETYDFSNLNFLNLRLSKVFALELISGVNYKLRTIGEDKFEIIQSETDKQEFEYAALSEPTTKTDYSKLVTFLGIRENLINLWGVDSLTSENLLDDYKKSCNNFMSYRSNGRLSQIPSIVENKNYEDYYYEYLKNIDVLTSKINKITLVSEKDSRLLQKLYNEHSGFKELIISLYDDNLDIELLNNHFRQDILNILQTEQVDWEVYSQNHFKVILMPGDHGKSVLEKSKLISNVVYKRKVEVFVESFFGMYPWIRNKDQKEIKQKIVIYFNERKDRFLKLIEGVIKIGFEQIENKIKSNDVKRSNRIENVLKAATPFMEFAKKAHKLDSKKQTNIKPATFEQLMLYFETRISSKFHDIKLTLSKDPKLAKELSQFFSIVAKEFNEKYLENNGLGRPQVKGDSEERSQALWDILVRAASDIYLTKSFDMSGMATIPLAVNLARDREELIRNPYTIPVFKDGTVAGVMHIDELYEAFQEKLLIDIPKRDVRMRTDYMLGIRPLFELGMRNNIDKITSGAFGIPRVYISKKGEIKIQGMDSDIGFDSLKRLYLSSLDFTKYEIAENLKVKDNLRKQREDIEGEEYESWWITEKAKYFLNRIAGHSEVQAEEIRRRQAMALKDADDKSKIIKSSAMLFARVFEVFHLPLVDIRAHLNIGGFALDFDEQKAIVKSELAKGYSTDALLRKEIALPEIVERWLIPNTTYGKPERIKVNEKKERSLLMQLAIHTYDDDAKKLDESAGKKLIDNAIDDVTTNIRGNIDTFCNADYFDSKNPQFRKAYNASKFLRFNLKSEHGTTPLNAKRIREFDHQIEKDVRTDLEAFNEDWLEPGLMFLGIATFIAIIIVFPLGGMIAAGASLPTGVATAVGITSGAMGAFNYVFFVMIIASTGTRLNSQLITVPAQLKYQQSIAHSQIESNKLVDYDMNKQEKRANELAAMITIGLMPLDIWFGHSIVSQIRTTTGHSGVSAMKKLTGIKLRKYSAPPESLRMNTHYGELKNKYGHVSAIYQKAINTLKNTKMRLPRYQMIPEEMLGVASLRIGISRKFKEMGIHYKPWSILDDVNSYHKKLSDRISIYKKLADNEKDILTKYVVEDGLKFGEVFEHGMDGIKNTKLIYMLRSEIKALKDGRFLDLRKNYGDVIDDVKHLQGELLKNKYNKLKGLKKKIEQFKIMRSADELIVTGNTQLTDDFLKILSDDEIMLFEHMAKKSIGPLKELKSVFKQYHTVTRSLSPMSYLFGKSGTEFTNPGVGQNPYTFLDERIDSQYVFKTDSEDIVNYYETMIRQHGGESDLIKDLRKPIEEEISNLFILDQFGKRLYY
jgi:hypothetical protein